LPTCSISCAAGEPRSRFPAPIARQRLHPTLQRRRPACQSADRRQPRSHRLGDRLAASRFGHAAGKKADGCDATSSDRRRPAAQFPTGLGARCGYAAKDSGRKSGSALRIRPALMSLHVKGGPAAIAIETSSTYASAQKARCRRYVRVVFLVHCFGGSALVD
jgi:hypothetical protein